MRKSEGRVQRLEAGGLGLKPAPKDRKGPAGMFRSPGKPWELLKGMHRGANTELPQLLEDFIPFTMIHIGSVYEFKNEFLRRECCGEK